MQAVGRKDRQRCLVSAVEPHLAQQTCATVPTNNTAVPTQERATPCVAAVMDTLAMGSTFLVLHQELGSSTCCGGFMGWQVAT